MTGLFTRLPCTSVILFAGQRVSYLRSVIKRHPFMASALFYTLAILICALSLQAWAAAPIKVTGSNDFSEIYGRLVGWIKGDLGRTLSISFVLIGLAYGMARNSLIGFATGVGAAVGLQVTPTIINSIFGF